MDDENLKTRNPFKILKNYWGKFGPGLTTGAADDDPSGIATYSQAGAQYGFQFLWLALFTAPLMSTVQEMCARLGLVTGRGLAANIRLHYPKYLLYFCSFLLLVANIFNIGADLGAMAKSSQLIFPNINFSILVGFFAIFSLTLQIFVPYKKYAPYLKYLTLSLLSYIFVGLLVNMDWTSIFLNTVIPTLHFTKNELFLICGILGTTISPYLFFWETSQEVEEEIASGRRTVRMRRGATKKEIHAMRVDSWTGMIFSNVIMFFIIAVCASTLFSNGVMNIETAEQAALALKPLAGHWAFLLFTLGILGTGFLAIPILAGSASYAISESFKWKEGLHRKFSEAIGFYSIIILSVLVGLAINFIGIDPIKALIYSAVINGIVAPVMLVFIVLLSSNEKVMGNKVNGPLTAKFGWLTVILMGLVSLATLLSLLF